nr:zinc finger, CCHC-type [Tanacetum cinerariifolium]
MVGDKRDDTSSSASLGEPGNVSLQCPKLTETNYTTWALIMETILKEYGIWEMIVAKEGETTNEEKDNTSKEIIFQTLPQDMLMKVAQYTTSKEVWNSIKVKHLGADLVQKAFPKKFLPIVASIEQYQEIDTMQFEEAVGRIITFEEQLKSQDEPENNYQNKLLLASSNNQGGGRGHGRYFTKNKSSYGKGMHEMERQEERQRARSTSHLRRRRTHIDVKSSEEDTIVIRGRILGQTQNQWVNLNPLDIMAVTKWQLQTVRKKQLF